MGVIVVVYAVFCLAVSEAKTEITCLFTKGRPEPIVILSVEAAGQVYDQPNERVRIPRRKRHPRCRPPY